MDLRLLTEPDELRELQPEWERLWAHVQPPSVFLAHEWFDAAWQWRQRSARLYLLCCRRGRELAGVLPLVREDSAAAGVQTLGFLAVPDTQACDLLAAPDDRSAIVTGIADELAKRQTEWDVLRLRYLPESSLAGTALAAALAGGGSRCQVRMVTGNPFIRLDSSWGAYYATRSRRLKKANNLAANRLRKSGNVRIDWLAPGTGEPADVDRVVDTIADISGRSWKTSTGNSLDRAAPQGFIRQLSHLAHRRGWLSIWILTLDGKPLAMEYQLVADGNVYALRSDFDAQYEQISPGAHLNCHLLEQLFGRGLHRYLMGPGENEYKRRWAEGAEPIYEMNVYGRSPRGQAVAAWELAMKPRLRSLRDRMLSVTSGGRRGDDSSQSTK